MLAINKSRHSPSRFHVTCMCVHISAHVLKNNLEAHRRSAPPTISWDYNIQTPHLEKKMSLVIGRQIKYSINKSLYREVISPSQINDRNGYSVTFPFSFLPPPSPLLERDLSNKKFKSILSEPTEWLVIHSTEDASLPWAITKKAREKKKENLG